MKKVLFLDRDGTLIVEPPEDYQVDSLEKLAFLPKVFRNLWEVYSKADFEFVMVTNQDGLGTESFPEPTFWPAHQKMLDAFRGEGVIFDQILIDQSFPHENLPTRKPNTGLLTHFLNNPEYDLANSYVVGDRLSDIQLAKNIGAQGIWISNEENSEVPEELKDTCVFVSEDWDAIRAFLLNSDRTARVHRQTKETDITIEVDLDGTGKSNIETGLGFFDHMLEQIARHGEIDLTIKTKGDLHIDEHHTIEDTALALGQAFREALGDKRGIMRYGFLLPMDEALAQVAIDFGGRPWLVWDAEFRREKVGDMPTEMFFHFFKSFSDEARCNLNIKVEGDNEHHKIEAIFKGFARAIRMAKTLTGSDELPST
ncbi:MAG: bifunctional histidinol-phosphatase/imidazoleglycerol-phosphate dehydratase HisB, partial [Bacteroidota bacterium]